MSIRVMTDVWDGSAADRGDLLVLLAIADFADDNGVAFPSIEALAEKARIGRRSVFKCLAYLRELGELEVISGRSEREVNTYQINVAKLHGAATVKFEERQKKKQATLEQRLRRVKQVHPRVASVQEGVACATEMGAPEATGIRHEPSKEPSKTLAGLFRDEALEAGDHKKDPPSELDLRAEFEEWYRQMPCHREPEAAWRAYAKARKTIPRDVLLQGAMRYAAYVEARKQRDPAWDFVKYPATWLNKGCWADKIDPSEGRRRGSNTMEALRRMGENG